MGGMKKPLTIAKCLEIVIETLGTQQMKTVAHVVVDHQRHDDTMIVNFVH